MSDLHPSLAERGASPLLLSAPLPPPQVWSSVFRLGFSLACLLVLAKIGFGELSGGWTIHGQHVGLLAGLLLSWGLSPILECLALARCHRGVDWAPGFYLFEAGLVDGGSPELPRLPMANVESIRVLRGGRALPSGFEGLELSFPGGRRVLLPVRAGDAAERMGRRIQELAGREPAWGSEAEEGPPPGSSSARVTFRRPLWPRLTAVLVALVVGILAWGHRDRLSDDLALEAALSSEGSGGLRLYLTNVGGRHSERVAGTELPRLTYSEALERKTMTALLDWHAEFRGERESAMFAEAHADLYREARRLLALRDGRGDASSAETRESLAALLDFQESAGSPPLALRFEEGSSNWLDSLDDLLEGHHDGRPVVRVGRHVRGIPLERRRRQLADALEEGLQLLLGSRLINLVHGDEEVPDDLPGVWVRGTVEPGTSVFEVEGRDEVFVELGLSLRLELSVPGAAPVTLDLSLETPDVFAAPDQPEREESSSAQIYEAMLRRVMDGLSEAFVKSFGGPGSSLAAPSPGGDVPASVR